jgi:hypothetical protein
VTLSERPHPGAQRAVCLELHVSGQQGVGFLRIDDVLRALLVEQPLEILLELLGIRGQPPRQHERIVVAQLGENLLKSLPDRLGERHVALRLDGFRAGVKVQHPRTPDRTPRIGAAAALAQGLARLDRRRIVARRHLEHR